jgi:WD40 repeat protein/serine/threonine protein kinase/energy-coupling factor transporter ATP-binding protein EcfA2
MLNITGQVIKSYEVGQRIGTGGFGAVFRANQAVVNREVAIKIILPEHANHPDFIRRFETEAQLVARLEHPHIVPLYDYWRDPSGAYLVMRFLRGGSLRDSLEDHGAWDAAKVAIMISQMASALTFAHQNGVIHRDLKSDNILLDETGNAYLSDFGIAKDLGGNMNLTKDSILGTPAYLAPEQIRGEVATPQSDIYALGIMTYEALAGTKPFFDVTPATVLFKQLNDPLPDISEIRDDLSSVVNTVLQRATSKDPESRYETAIAFARDLQEAIFQAIGYTPTTHVEVSMVADLMDDEDIQNPYKGLRAFQQADSANFFGRDALIGRILERLLERVDSRDFLAVIGPSGSGKSSVVKAGVLPRIQQGILDETRDWYSIEMVPGTHPFEELEVALMGIASDEIPNLREQLLESERGLVRAVKRLLPSEDAELVLLIDQFEELFTLVEREEVREKFLAMLGAAVADQRSRIKIIVTLRADFYDRPLMYGDFGELIRQRTELVLPLNQEELTESIVEPAKQVSVHMENGLVEAIIKDVKQQPGALPLLQYALTELFERRTGRMMTLKAYQDIGGTAGALARRAEELYTQFDDDKRDTARQLFMRLVTLGDGAEDTRRRVLQAELLSITSQQRHMNDIIEDFGRYRLLTLDHDPATRSSTVEVAHEALIRQWERLRGWLDENREGLRLQRRLTSATEEWLASGKDRSFLARGVRLQQFEDLAKTHEFAQNETELAYLEASIAARVALEAQERAQKEREEHLEQQARSRLRALAGVMSIAAIVGIALAIIAILQSQAAASAQMAAEDARIIAEQNEEQAQRSAAEASSLALAANARNAVGEGDSQLALILAIEAQRAYTPAPAEVMRVLSNTAYAEGPRYRFDAHSGSVTDVRFSADGRYAVSGGYDGQIIVWDITTGDGVMVVDVSADETFVLQVDIAPDGSSVAGALSDGTVGIFAVPSGDILHRITAHTGITTAITYSTDGNSVISGGDDWLIHRWRVSDGGLMGSYRGHRGVILALDTNSTDTRLISSSADATMADSSTDEEERFVNVWNMTAYQLAYTIDPESGFVRTIDFSPDDSMIAVGIWDSGNSGTARIYDAQTGEETERFFAHTTPLTAVRFSPDSRYLVTAAWDRNVRVWDIRRGIEVDNFVGFTDRILAVDYSQGGDYLAIAVGNIGDNDFELARDNATDTSVWLWDITNRDQILAFEGHRDWLWTVDISANGELAASGSGPLRLPTTQQGEEVVSIDTSIRIWRIDTGEEILRLDGHSNTVDSVKFLPDNERILSSAWDGLIILWDINTGERLNIYRGHDGAVYKLALLNNGEQFLSAGGDGRILLWDTATGEILRQFEGHESAVNGIMPNSDETLLISGSSDRTLRLWDLTTGEEIRQFTGHTSTVNEAIFSPDGNSVVSSSWDDTIRMWDVATGAEVRQFTGHNGNTFGLAFSDDGAILLSTSQDTTVRMWDVASGEELHRYSAHTDWIQEVFISPDGTFAISAGQDLTARIWRIDRTSEALVTFAENNRYIREFTCAELERYRLGVCSPNDTN